MTTSVTHRLISDFVQILGSKFWALGGLNQKSKNNVLQFWSYRELMAKNGPIPSRNKKEKSMFVTNRRTDRQSQRQKIIDS